MSDETALKYHLDKSVLDIMQQYGFIFKSEAINYVKLCDYKPEKESASEDDKICSYGVLRNNRGDMSGICPICKGSGIAPKEEK